ncbi:hypothetical protein VDG1235_3634 [Verrucomicrobiia bacterium DG1235]|nr:hypothetical protein VDG1235_3634 [Verrucomicrobiae bacterium DG1235]
MGSMALEELQVDPENEKIPDAIDVFLLEADRRCDEFFDTALHKKMPRFLPADYTLVYRAIRTLQKNYELLGNRFCEWGSGLGTATCLASFAGLDACGIEIQPELVNRSRKLAKDFDLSASFIEGSFLPEGFDFLATQGGQELATPPRSRHDSIHYPDTDWELSDIDLFYAYPWPEEQESTLKLFDTVATEGAYLICYFGDGELCIYRKKD